MLINEDKAFPSPSQPAAEGTPRTDAFNEQWDRYNFPAEAIDFARTLERELASMRRAAEVWMARAENTKRELAEAKEKYRLLSAQHSHV